MLERGRHTTGNDRVYLAARHQAQGIQTAGLVKSMALYRQAIALDPTFALAQAGLAESKQTHDLRRRWRACRRVRRREVFGQSAIELEPDLAEGYSVGWNQFWNDWDWDGAERTFKHASC